MTKVGWRVRVPHKFQPFLLFLSPSFGANTGCALLDGPQRGTVREGQSGSRN